jgi:hypothetical protein
MAVNADQDPRWKEVIQLIESLELSDLQKHLLRTRWLEQVRWLEGRAIFNRKSYHTLRLAAIVGGVIVPALVSLQLSGNAAAVVHWLTFGLSLVVALSAAIEEFFHNGERWRHYRRTVELLKSEGWQFFQRSGPYQGYASHAEAFQAFAGQVESICQHEVDAYINTVAQERERTQLPLEAEPTASS